MAIFVLLAIGFALMFGHKDLAQSLVKPFIGLVLVLSLALPLIDSCGARTPRVCQGTTSCGKIDNYNYNGSVAIAGLALAVLGWLLWRRRRQGRHGGPPERLVPPRRRALPPPPTDRRVG